MLYSEFKAVINKSAGRHEYYALFVGLKLEGIIPNDSDLLKDESFDNHEVRWIAPANVEYRNGVLEMPCIEVHLAGEPSSD